MKDIVTASQIGPDRIQVGAVKFSTDTKREFYLNQYSTQATLIDAIDNIEYRGGETNIAGGLDLVLTDLFNTNGDRPDAINILIIITDGESNINEANTIPAAGRLKDNNVIIVSVGVTNDVDEAELLGMASSSDLVFAVDDFTGLTGIINALIEVTCTLVEIRPSPPVPTGKSHNALPFNQYVSILQATVLPDQSLYFLIFNILQLITLSQVLDVIQIGVLY